MDQLNKPVVQLADQYRIPTREEHRRRVRRIWVTCMATSAVFVVGLVVLANAWHAWNFGALFQIAIAGAFFGITVPLFLEQRANATVAIEMNRQTVDAISDLDTNLKPIVSDLKHIGEQGRPVADAMKKAIVDEKILQKIEGHMEAIRKRLAVEPVSTARRPTDPAPAGAGR